MKLLLNLVLCGGFVLGLACIESVSAGNPPQSISTPAVPSRNATPPSSSAFANTNSKATNLGKINVTAMRQLIKTLQVVKVALNEPYSTSRDKANVVVCRIITGHGRVNVEERMGAILECGTNSWFTWRSDKCRNGGLQACMSNANLTAAYKRKGAWHSRRALNLQQVMAMRALLKKLPAPGKGEVVVVDKNGKAVMTVKESAGSAGSGKN